MARRARRAHGNIGIWAVLSFTVVGSFMALSIHAGRSYSNRVELQNAADAAALAAAAHLDGTQAGLDAALQAATAFGSEHRTEDVTVGITPADVTFGSWDRSTQTFTPILGRAEADLQRIIAVHVRDRRLDLPVAFGPVFLDAAAVTSVAASAVAAGGGPCEDRCAFPAAFADCMIMDAAGNLNCDDDRFYVLSNDWQDNFGLTSLDPTKSASVPNVKDALQQCVNTSADTEIPVTNGNPVQPVFTPPLGYPLEVFSPVVHAERCEPARYETCVSSSPTDPCMNAKFNGDMQILGYVSLVVCYVTKSVVKDWPPLDWGPTAASSAEELALWNECGPPPSLADFPGVPPTSWPDPFLKQTIFFKRRCHWVDPGSRSRRGGCQSFGLWTSRSRLVQ